MKNDETLSLRKRLAAELARSGHSLGSWSSDPIFRSAHCRYCRGVVDLATITWGNTNVSASALRLPHPENPMFCFVVSGKLWVDQEPCRLGKYVAR